MEKKCNIEHQAKWNKCDVSINGIVYRLSCEITDAGMCELYLGDKCLVSEKYWVTKLKGFDYAIEIGGETIHCVFDEEKFDIAIHGKYQKSQKKYVPLKVVYIIFMALCILTPINFLMAVSGTMDAAVLALSLVIIGSVRIYYNRAIKELK